MNLGPWLWYIDGYINVDIDPSVKADLHCDALNLPFEENSVNSVICGHLLEHVHPKDTDRALAHWAKILKPGGTITITVPDFEKAYHQWKKGELPFGTLHGVIFGEALGREANKHLNIFNEDLLREAMSKHFVDLETLGYFKYWAGTVPWQTCIQAKKAPLPIPEGGV